MAIDFKPLDKATFNKFKDRTQRPENKDYWIDRAFKTEETADKTQAELLRRKRKMKNLEKILKSLG
jgi:hypothetical protein